MSEGKKSKGSEVQAPAGGMCLTAEQAKAKVYEKGLTLKEFSRRRGLSYRTVSEVVRGVNKGLFGEGHKAAVALGMKRG